MPANFNARPTRRFLFRLAGHLGMTVGEIENRMDSRELSEWMAYARYFQPLDSSWEQAGLIASAVVSPYSKHSPPAPWDFVPVEKPPQHASQIRETLAQIKRDIEQP